MDPVTFLLLITLGSWVTLDTTAAGQFMVSRPFVAATLAGWIAGDAALGALIGVLLESFHLTILPVGAARYPEGGSAAVAAGGSYVVFGVGTESLLTVLVFALLWEWVAGESVRQMRVFNGRFIPGENASPADHVRLHWMGLVSDALRGVTLTAGGFLVLGGFLFLREQIAPMPSSWQLGVALATAAGLTASALSLFGGRMQGMRFAAGAAAGILAGLLVAG